MIKIGDTFRSVYADSNALWKVIKKKGKDVYLCEIVNEPIEHEGRFLDGGYAGVQKAFLVQEIERSINFKNIFNKIANECEKFYNSLKEGDVVHYHDGFNQFVRCRVNQDKELVPFALVGNWRNHDLPKRGIDGKVVFPYTCRMIVERKPFKPNATNIYEYPEFNRKNTNPVNLPEINISVPEQSESEKEVSRLWVNIQEIHEYINQEYIKNGSKDRDPKSILKKIKEMAS